MSLRLWHEHVVPRVVDVSLRAPELDDLRQRACRPRGPHVLEHGHADSEVVRRWQRRLEPAQRLAGGCHLSRDVPALVASSGWRVKDMESFALPGPAVARPWTFVHVGTATPA